MMVLILIFGVYVCSAIFAAILELATNPEATPGGILRMAAKGPVVVLAFLWMALRR